MKPIISPWVIYFAEVGDTIKSIALVVAFIAVIASLIGIATELDASAILDDEEHKVAMKWIKGGSNSSDYKRSSFYLYTIKRNNIYNAYSRQHNNVNNREWQRRC